MLYNWRWRGLACCILHMGHSVDSNITNRYIDAFPLAQQMEFNSRLLKLNDDADIMEALKGLTTEQLKALIAMVKKS